MWPTELMTEDRFPSGDWCPHPERWHSTDGDSTEVEVSKLVGAFVRALQPDLVFESGSAWGQTSRCIGDALTLCGQGMLITCEIDPERVAATAKRCGGLPVTVDPRPSQEVLKQMRAQGSKVGFAWLDSLFELRVPELVALTPMLTPGAIVGIHDCGDSTSTKFPEFSAVVETAARRLGFTRLALPTPRGVTFLGWRA